MILKQYIPPVSCERAHTKCQQTLRDWKVRISHKYKPSNRRKYRQYTIPPSYAGHRHTITTSLTNVSVDSSISLPTFLYYLPHFSTRLKAAQKKNFLILIYQSIQLFVQRVFECNGKGTIPDSALIFLFWNMISKGRCILCMRTSLLCFSSNKFKRRQTNILEED